MATVLIIEDEEPIANLIKMRLEEEGYSTIVSYTGAEGLKQIEKQHPEALSLDIHLPDIDGRKILEKIRSEKNNICVIVVSSDDAEKECKEKGANDFVKKPINFSKLIDSIKKG